MLWNYVMDIVSYYMPEVFGDIYYRACYNLPEAVVAVLISSLFWCVVLL